MPRHYPCDEPFFLQWHITDDCNLACAHCYRETTRRRALPLDSLLAVLDQFERFLQALGRKGRLHLAGGEPLLSPYLFPLLRAAQQKAIPCRLLSNGTLATPELASHLADAGCRWVQVSVEGGRAVHDALRGPGSFDRALAGIEALRAAGIQVTVGMTLSRRNAGEIEVLMEQMRPRAARFHLARWVPLGQSVPSGEAPLLSPDELREAFRTVLRTRKRWPALEVPLRDPLWHEYLRVSPVRQASLIHGCSIGYNGLALEADGTIYPCRRLPIPLGQIQETDFLRVWNESPLLQQLRNRDLLKGKCSRCRRRWLCGGCRAMAMALHGDPLAEDPQCFARESILQRTRTWVSGHLTGNRTDIRSKTSRMSGSRF